MNSVKLRRIVGTKYKTKNVQIDHAKWFVWSNSWIATNFYAKLLLLLNELLIIYVYCIHTCKPKHNKHCDCIFPSRIKFRILMDEKQNEIVLFLFIVSALFFPPILSTQYSHYESCINNNNEANIENQAANTGKHTHIHTQT